MSEKKIWAVIESDADDLEMHLNELANAGKQVVKIMPHPRSISVLLVVAVDLQLQNEKAIEIATKSTGIGSLAALQSQLSTLQDKVK